MSAYAPIPPGSARGERLGSPAGHALFLDPSARLILALLLLALAACDSGSDSPPGGSPADVGVAQDSASPGSCEEPCPSGTYCAENGECLQGCARDEDCQENEICNRGSHACEERACVEDSHCPAERPRCYAAEGRCGCGRAEDCEPGQSCTMNGWCVPEGKECDPSEQDKHCRSGRVCTADGWCVPEGLECRADHHCEEGLHCTERGFCLPRGIECQEADHCRPDKVCNDQGFCVAEGLECEANEHCQQGQECNPQGFCVRPGRRCEMDGHCPPGFRCEDASGDCVPTDDSCLSQGCPEGQECNRFGLCAPDGIECSAPEHCPATQRCLDTGFCAPQDVDCNDPQDCGEPDLTCNPYGVCVSRVDDIRNCAPCESDADCGSHDGVCLNENYSDRQGRPLDVNACLIDCRSDQDCPPAMACFSYRRLDRPVGVCKPLATTCTGWLNWERDCYTDLQCGEYAICRDLHTDLRLDLQCTWECSSDDECMNDARCGEFGYCRY